MLIGVGHKGELVGVSDAPTLVRRIESQLPKLISPRALWTVEQLHVAGKDVVIVEVPEGMDRPYVAEGAIYFRRGERVVPATRDEISALIRKRTEASLRYERQISIGADREDLDEKLIRETARMAVESERWQGSPGRPQGFLQAFGLTAHGGVTNAGLILYGRRPTRVLPQARVRLLVMPEGKTGNHYSVDKIFDGCLLRIAQEIPPALTTYAGGVESTFSPRDWQRSERSLYPMTALREGVLNALVDRDYGSSGSITISILPDSDPDLQSGGAAGWTKTVRLEARSSFSASQSRHCAHLLSSPTH